MGGGYVPGGRACVRASELLGEDGFVSHSELVRSDRHQEKLHWRHVVVLDAVNTLRQHRLLHAVEDEREGRAIAALAGLRAPGVDARKRDVQLPFVIDDDAKNLADA